MRSSADTGCDCSRPVAIGSSAPVSRLAPYRVGAIESDLADAGIDEHLDVRHESAIAQKRERLDARSLEGLSEFNGRRHELCALRHHIIDKQYLRRRFESRTNSKRLDMRVDARPFARRSAFPVGHQPFKSMSDPCACPRCWLRVTLVPKPRP